MLTLFVTILTKLLYASVVVASTIGFGIFMLYSLLYNILMFLPKKIIAKLHK